MHGGGFAPAETQLTVYGKIAAEQLLLLEQRYPSLTLDQYIIMPNHIPAVLMLQDSAEASPRSTVMDIVCSYKSLTVRQCKKAGFEGKFFQNSFYDHVIRGRQDYLEIAEYIQGNPDRWQEDKLYMQG